MTFMSGTASHRSAGMAGMMLMAALFGGASLIRL
jgi:hypothetical protein